MSIEAKSTSSDAFHTLDGYSCISLPDLSHVRNPAPGIALIKSDVHPACTEGLFVAALARCLGAYCAANDILLGWPTKREQRAVRVRWKETTTWNQIIRELSPFSVSEDEVREFVGIQDKQTPFVAIVASESEANVDHSLVASFSASRVSMKFSTGSLHRSVAEMLLSQVKEIISRAVEEPDQIISLSFLPGNLLSRVDLTPEVEPYSHVLNVQFASDFLPLHDPETIVIEYHPDLTSTGGVARTLSFGELRTLSNQFAHYLLDLGLEIEDKVAVSLPKCPELYIAIMGIWKAGGCYVPVDPDLPSERREFIIADSNARFIIDIDNVRGHLEGVAQYPTEDINVARLDALSYMLYTSGTTGTPKGCLLTQEGLTQALMGLSFDAKFTDCDSPRFLAVAAIAFDVHISEFLLPCALGMTHVVVPRSQVLEDLALWIRRLRITHFGSVPSLIEATLVHIDDAELYLRYISCGGEKMTDVILDRWGGHPVTKLMNYYGPSEVTIGCSSMRMSPTTRRESIGRIFNNSSAYVMDENLNLVARGVAGELLVGGPLVGRGYHNRDDLTKKSFVNWEGQKLYRTGDLVRLMPDDTMEMLGRIDTQIKLRGVRIEVEGISAVVRNAAMKTPGLSSKTKVDVCSILGRHPSIQSDQLVSFVTWTTSASISERRSRQPKVLQEPPKGMLASIKDACRTELASYMRPAHIIFVEFLPLNSNGKTDAKVLAHIFTSLGLDVLGAQTPPPNGIHAQYESSPSRPPTEMEKEVMNIVSDLSSIPQSSIKLTSNLFELGFDSLKFIRLTAVLRSKFSLTSQQWPVNEVMSCESTLQLCSSISNRLVADLKRDQAPFDSDAFITEFEMRMKPRVLDSYESNAIEAVYPTFPLQDGVLYRSSSDNTLYIQHVIMKLGSAISESRLKGAWAMMQRRHEILRTVFHFSNAIAQIVLKAERCTLPWDVLDSSVNDTQPVSTRFYDDHASSVEIDINTHISTKPPFRLLFVKDTTSSYLVLSIHHAIFDARSLDLLFADVEGVYREQPLETTASLSDSLRCIYATDVQKAEGFWKSAFEGFMWPRMAPVATTSERLTTLDITLNTSYGELLARATKARATLSTLCTVAFAVCVARHVYASTDVVFGTIWSGRSYADKKFDDAQCPLLSVVPTRVQLNKGASVVQELQRHSADALAYAHIPLGRVQRWLRSGNPVFEILFSTALDENYSSTLWDVVSSAQPAADFPLAVEVRHKKNVNDVQINAAFTGVFGESVVWQILQEFEGVLISLSADVSSNALETFRSSVTSNTAHNSYLEDGESTESEMESHENEELESKLRDIVSRFLEVSSDNLNANSSFISLGLDSIKSIGLSRAMKAEGLKISAVGLMKHSSIRHLARFLQAGFAESSVPDGMYTADASEILESRRREIAANVNVQELQLRVDDSVELFPTTDLQSGMLSQTVNSSENLYVHEFAFKLGSTVNIGRLREAWVKTMEECAILRTSFHFLIDAGTWIQAVHSVVDLNWHDLRESSSKSVAEVAQEFIRAQNFTEESALSRPPVHLLIWGQGAGASPTHLILVLHHALYDGVSIPILKKHVDTFYERGVLDFQDNLPTVQFHNLLGQILYQEIHGVEFWKRYMSGCSPQVWRRVRGTDHNEKGVAHACTNAIPVPHSKLRDAIAHYGVTTQCLGQAAMAEGLASIHQVDEVTFGHVLSGRNIYGSEDVVGPMITTVPCRVKLDSLLKVNLGAIRSIHWHNVEAGSWQHISLRKVQQGFGRRSFWDSLFVFQSLESVDESGTQVLAFDDSVEETFRLQYPLNVELFQTEDGFTLKAACQTNALTSIDLKVFVDTFSRSLLGMIETPLNNGANGHIVSQAVPVSRRQDSTEEHTRVFPLAIDEYPAHADFLDILSQSVKVPVSLMRTDMSLASMGVDSISSIQIAARCRSSGLKLRAPQILNYELLSDLLHSISNVKSDGFGPQNKAHTPMETLQNRKRNVNPEATLPASPGMTWLVAMWQNSRRRQFQYCFTYRLAKNTSIPRLQQAWIQLTKVHPILRSTFDTVDGSRLQVRTFQDLSSEEIWSTIRLEGQRKEVDIVQDLTEALVSNPSSTKRPPMRAILIRGQESLYLVLHLHHFLYDAWSLKILTNDLRSLYSDVQRIPHKPDELARFLRYCQPNDTQKSEQRNFWQTHLKVPFVPTLLPKAIPTQKGNKRRLLISSTVIKNVEVVREKARQLSVTLSALLIACWAQVHSKLCDTQDVTFGLWQSGRSGDLEGIEEIAVPCMNVLPIRIDSTDMPSVESCRLLNSHLRRRSGFVEQTFLEDIRHWTKLNKGPMFDVCLNILDSRVGTGSSGLLEPLNIPYYIPEIPDYVEESGPKTLSICDLIRDSVMAEIIVRDDVIDVSIEYDPEYLDNLRARSLVEDWSRALQDILHLS